MYLSNMKTLVFLLLFFSIILCTISTIAQTGTVKPEIGIVQDFERDSLMYAYGYRCIVESIVKCISPKQLSEEAFVQQLSNFKQLKVPIYAFNIFMPGDMKLVGPDVNRQAILDYSRIVFARCQRAGINMIIWGSGGARRVPDGFDHEKATAQFIEVARDVASLAKEFNIILALENLNSTETNFINTVEDALKTVKAVDKPNFRLCADIYHMLMENESAEILRSTKGYLIHCDIAEKNGRTPPGVNGDDFRPYLKALRDVGYSGKIILECRWKDIFVQGLTARTNLQRQIDEVYNN